MTPQVPGGVSDGRWHSVLVQYYNKVGGYLGASSPPTQASHGGPVAFPLKMVFALCDVKSSTVGRE